MLVASDSEGAQCTLGCNVATKRKCANQSLISGPTPRARRACLSARCDTACDAEVFRRRGKGERRWRCQRCSASPAEDATTQLSQSDTVRWASRDSKEECSDMSGALSRDPSAALDWMGRFGASDYCSPARLDERSCIGPRCAALLSLGGRQTNTRRRTRKRIKRRESFAVVCLCSCHIRLLVVYNNKKKVCLLSIKI